MPLTAPDAAQRRAHDDTKRRGGGWLAPLCVSLLVFATARLTPASRSPLDTANDAWRRGDYIAALNGYIQLLGGADADADLEPIALTTGELFVTEELTRDGRAPRFSPDGRFIVYETGLETSRRTLVVENSAARNVVADL